MLPVVRTPLLWGVHRTFPALTASTASQAGTTFPSARPGRRCLDISKLEAAEDP